MGFNKWDSCFWKYGLISRGGRILRSGVSLSLSFVAREKSEQVWLVVDVVLAKPEPSSTSGEEHPNALGDGVEMELRKFVYSQ